MRSSRSRPSSRNNPGRPAARQSADGTGRRGRRTREPAQPSAADRRRREHDERERDREQHQHKGQRREGRTEERRRAREPPGRDREAKPKRRDRSRRRGAAGDRRPAEGRDTVRRSGREGGERQGRGETRELRESRGSGRGSDRQQHARPGTGGHQGEEDDTGTHGRRRAALLDSAFTSVPAECRPPSAEQRRRRTVPWNGDAEGEEREERGEVGEGAQLAVAGEKLNTAEHHRHGGTSALQRNTTAIQRSTGPRQHSSEARPRPPPWFTGCQGREPGLPAPEPSGPLLESHPPTLTPGCWHSQPVGNNRLFTGMAAEGFRRKFHARSPGAGREGVSEHTMNAQNRTRRCQ